MAWDSQLGTPFFPAEALLEGRAPRGQREGAEQTLMAMAGRERSDPWHSWPKPCGSLPQAPAETTQTTENFVSSASEHSIPMSHQGLQKCFRRGWLGPHAQGKMQKCGHKAIHRPLQNFWWQSVLFKKCVFETFCCYSFQNLLIERHCLLLAQNFAAPPLLARVLPVQVVEASLHRSSVCRGKVNSDKWSLAASTWQLAMS